MAYQSETAAKAIQYQPIGWFGIALIALVVRLKLYICV